MEETVTEMLAGCSGLIKSVHICMLITKVSFQLWIKMWDSVYKQIESFRKLFVVNYFDWSKQIQQLMTNSNCTPKFLRHLSFQIKRLFKSSPKKHGGWRSYQILDLKNVYCPFIDAYCSELRCTQSQTWQYCGLKVVTHTIIICNS